MNIKSLFYGWLIPVPWNRKALEDFADFIEDHPEIAQPGDNILWCAARVFFVQCLHPVSHQLDRGALAHYLRLPMWKIFHMAYPVSEKQVPGGVTISDITHLHVVTMLRHLARTGKVNWQKRLFFSL